MVGGGDDAFARSKDIFAPMAGRVVPCGGDGAGQAAKICNNMMLGISMTGVCEDFALGEKLGPEHQALFDVMSTSSGLVLVSQHLLPGSRSCAHVASQ